MTFVGKMLVVVQVVLSICFMAFAGAVYSYQQSWKEAAEKRSDRIAVLETQLTETEASLRVVKADAAAAEVIERDLAEFLDANQLPKLVEHIDDPAVRAEIESLANKLAKSNEQVTTLQDKLTAEQTAHREDVKKYAETLVDAGLAKKAAQERLVEATRYKEINENLNATLDQTVRDLQSYRDQLFERNTKIAEMSEQQELFIEKLAESYEQVKKTEVQMVGAELPTTDVPPDVRGQVVRTAKSKSGSYELVELTIGSNDGLERGHILYVFRTTGKGKYLGQLRVVHVTADVAVGQLIEETKNGIIEAGDDVRTRL